MPETLEVVLSVSGCLLKGLESIENFLNDYDL